MFRLIETTNNSYINHIGAEGSLFYSKNNTSFFFKTSDLSIEDKIAIYLGHPDVWCEEVYIENNNGITYKFQRTDYEKIADFSFCNK